MTKRYRSDALAALHVSLEALHDIGAIDKRTLRKFDEAYLSPVLPSWHPRISAPCVSASNCRDPCLHAISTSAAT